RRRHAVSFGVFEQVAQQPAQQPGITADLDRRAFEMNVVVARAFFRRKRQQVDVLGDLERADGVEAARKQYLVDESVELRDVPLDAGLGFFVSGAFHEVQRETYSSKRRAQFVRRVGEQRAMGTDELFDLARRAIEARREPRDLVAAFDLD